MLLVHPQAAALVKVAATDESRSSMTAVRLCDLGKGQAYKLEATDGRRLLTMQAHAPEGSGPLGAPEALIPAKLFAEAMALGQREKGRMRKDTCVGFEVSADEVIRAETALRSVAGPVQKGKFPDFRHVLPKKPATWAVDINPALLAETLLALARMTGEESRRVRLLFFTDAKGAVALVGLSCQNPEGLYVDGLVMPLTDGEQK